MINDPTGTAESEHDPTLERLWGKANPTRRGPRRALDIRDIVNAALQLADAGGLSAVSMARVAEALDCSVMGLYRHVTSKDELLAFLADRVAADAPVIPADIGWRAGLHLWTRLQIDGLLAHPWLLDLPLAAMPLGPHRARWLDQGFATMRSLELPQAEKGLVLGLLSQHALAEARVMADLQRVATSPYTDLSRTINRLVGPDELPDLVAALAADPAGPTDEDFGIDLILDGVEARLRRRFTEG